MKAPCPTELKYDKTLYCHGIFPHKSQCLELCLLNPMGQFLPQDLLLLYVIMFNTLHRFYVFQNCTIIEGYYVIYTTPICVTHLNDDLAFLLQVLWNYYRNYSVSRNIKKSKNKQVSHIKYVLKFSLYIALCRFLLFVDIYNSLLKNYMY